MGLPSRTEQSHRTVVAACIVVVTALAWAYLIQIDRHMTIMSSMGMATTASWGASEVFLAFVMWTVMMVGMMSASAAPVLILFAGAHSARDGRAVSLPVLLFGLGCITVWAGFSAVAALAQWGLRQAALLSPAMAASSPYFAGAILIGAGMYQLTPLSAHASRNARARRVSG